MSQEKIYSPGVESLVDKVSYGSLGILDMLARYANSPQNTKYNVLLVNVATLVRNVLNQKIDHTKIMDAVSFEASQFRDFYDNYAVPGSILIFYLQSNVYNLAPPKSSRTITQPRSDVMKYAKMVVLDEGIRPNSIKNIGSGTNIRCSGLHTIGSFVYKELQDIIRLDVPVPNVMMVSHCPLDYFLFDHIKGVVVDSHTGKIVKPADFGMKLFKDLNIPFNRTTLKLFGDKEFVSPLVRRTVLNGENLRLKTERELVHLATSKWKVDPKDLAWKI